MLPLQIQLTLPPWIGDVADSQRRFTSDDDARIGLAIELARHNVDRGDGGPFGAAVFDGRQRTADRRCGVNRVMPETVRWRTREMMALMLAQQRLERHRLNEADGRYVLATSAQPCCQCYGATGLGRHRRVADRRTRR